MILIVTPRRELERRGTVVQRRRAGASAVEFAVVAPLFFLFVLGLITLSRGFMVMHELTDAARVGCRVGIIAGRTNSDIDTAVQNHLNALGIKTAVTNVYVNGQVGNASSAKTNDALRVEVLVPAKDVTWLPGYQYMNTGQVKGQFTLQRE